MLISYILFALGLALIIKGGDFFVDSATWMARITHIPEVVIGATIVSLATTFPETSVSVIAAIRNQPSMAVGNAIGSTICNTGLILGMYNLIKPSTVSSKVFAAKGLLMVSYIIIFWFLSGFKVIDTSSSFILLLLLALYAIFNMLVIGYKRKPRMLAKDMELQCKPMEYVWQPAKFIFGITLIILGANLLVDHGVIIAKYFGVPSSLISLTLIALGTSLPELVTAVTALLKGHSDLSIGNILGANILNITMVLGLSSQFLPLEISKQTYYFDVPVSIAINALLVIPSIITKKITRLQSMLLVAGYFSYIAVLFYIS